VVIARSDLYPDALAAAPLAAKVGGPLLLSPPSGLTPSLKAEVTRLGATTAYLVGDTTALSAQVAADLHGTGVTTIIRIGGPTRYDTAALIAHRVGGTRAFVARGDDWPDAASAAQLAARLAEPVLLTPKDSLDPAVSETFADLRITSATIVGGPAAVTASVETAITHDGVNTTRFAGADRYATSVAVAQQIPGQGADAGVTLVSGRNWPDAIAAGPSTTHPLVLVDPTNLANSPATKAWLMSRSTSIVVAVGGPDVVSPAVATGALG
jgi:putative cell wall-binding protein